MGQENRKIICEPCRWYSTHNQDTSRDTKQPIEGTRASECVGVLLLILERKLVSTLRLLYFVHVSCK
jgi:hypothetical protein